MDVEPDVVPLSIPSLEGVLAKHWKFLKHSQFSKIIHYLGHRLGSDIRAIGEGRVKIDPVEPVA